MGRSYVGRGVLAVAALSVIITIVHCSPGQPYGGNMIVTPCDPGQPEATQVFSYDKSTGLLSTDRGDGAEVCVQVESASAAPLANVQTWDCDSKAAEQQWSPLSSDSFQLVSSATGFCMEVGGVNGINIVMDTCDSYKPQQFWTVHGGTGAIYITSPWWDAPAPTSAWCLTNEGLLTLDAVRASPLIIGHRGTTDELPENTMMALRYGIENSDGIETDLRFTKDGVVIIMHDDTMSRTTNCTGNVNSYTLEEFRKCDACSWFDPNLHCPPPTFEEVVELIMEFQAKRPGEAPFIVMDQKVEGLAEAVNHILKKHGAEYNAIASCWTDSELATYAEKAPEIVRQKLSSTQPGDSTTEYFRTQLQNGLRGFSLKYTSVNPNFIRSAHSHLMSVVAWTPDTQAAQVSVIEQGFDGIITGLPAMAVQMVARDRQRRGYSVSHGPRPFA